MHRKHGFTLTELMVSMAVVGVVTVFLTDMLTRQNRAYTVVDHLTETQQNLRAVGDLLEGELRATGFLVPEAAAVCGVDATNGSDVLYVTDASSLDPTGQSQLGIGASVILGYDGSGSDTLTLGNLSLDGTPFYDTDGDGVGDSDFLQSVAPARNGGVIVADRANPVRGASCGIITNVGGGSITVDFTSGGRVAGTPLAAVPPGGNLPDLVAVPAHVYLVNGTQLMRDGMVLAQDVEDLQFALFYDVDDDGTVTGAAPGGPPFRSALEYPGSAAPGIPYLPNAWDNSDLREIRVNLVGRTRAQDTEVLQNPGIAQGQFQATENRVAPLANDGFRRRVLTLTVRPRNVGGREIGG